MGKERFSAFDVCAEVSCLRRTLLGLWCSQIYDGEGKNALLFKFNKPAAAAANVSVLGEGGGTADGESAKVHLLVQPGVKLLNTRYASSSSSSSGNGNNNNAITSSNKVVRQISCKS